MFLDYYKLEEQPFGVTPDTRLLYLGSTHREALASLVYGTESDRGFLALIAEPGTGKICMLYHYLNCLQDKARRAVETSAGADTASPSIEQVRSVNVMKDRALYCINVAKFGKGDAKVLEQIRRSNPWPSGSGRIQLDQKLRIPLTNLTAEDTQRAAEQVISALTARTGRQ